MCKFTNNTKHSRIDKCMKPLVNFLNKQSCYTVVACCCGHHKYPITVVTKWMIDGEPKYMEILSGMELYRKRKFYKKDKQGYYFIPEVSKIR